MIASIACNPLIRLDMREPDRITCLMHPARRSALPLIAPEQWTFPGGPVCVPEADSRCTMRVARDLLAMGSHCLSSQRARGRSSTASRCSTLRGVIHLNSLGVLDAFEESNPLLGQSVYAGSVAQQGEVTQRRIAVLVLALGNVGIDIDKAYLLYLGVGTE